MKIIIKYIKKRSLTTVGSVFEIELIQIEYQDSVTE